MKERYSRNEGDSALFADNNCDKNPAGSARDKESSRVCELSLLWQLLSPSCV